MVRYLPFNPIHDGFPLSQLLTLGEKSAPTRSPMLPLGPPVWRRLLRFVQRERVAGIFYHNLQALSISPPAEIADELEPMRRTLEGRAVLLGRQAQEVLKAFSQRSIPCMPLKGIFLTAFVYPSIGLRDMGDIDLMIPLSYLGEADATLHTLGYRSLEALDRNGVSYSIYRNSRVYTSERNALRPSTLHLHWHWINASVPLLMYAIDVDALWREAKGVKGAPLLGSCSVPAPHHMLLHLCEHGLKHSFHELIHLADIAAFLALYGQEQRRQTRYRELFPTLDWDAVFRTASAWRLEKTLRYALLATSRFLEIPLPIFVEKSFASLPSNLWGRIFMNAMLRNQRWNGLSILGYLSMCRTFHEQVRFLQGAFFPPTKQLEHFGKAQSWHGYATRAWNVVRRTLRSRKT